MKKKKEPSIFRQELKRDWNTMKSLHGAKRLQFLWDYYKLPAVLALTLIIAAGVFAHMLWEGQKPCRLRVCAVLNTERDCSLWFHDFSDELKKDGKAGAVDLNQDQPFDYDNQYYYLHELEVMTTVSSQRMDVAVCNADMYQYLLALDACLPLDEALPEDFFQNLSEQDMLDYNTANLQVDEDGNIDPADGIDGCYAVNLDGTKFADTYNQPEADEVPEPLYAVVISNTKHLDDSIALLRSLTE